MVLASSKRIFLKPTSLAMCLSFSLSNKRFESSGQIALESLLKLSLVLECLGDFSVVCEGKEVMPKSIEELL